MSKIKEILLKDSNEVNELIKETPVNAEEYTHLLNLKDDIRNELIKLEQIEKDADMKYEQIVQDTNVRRSQIESENKREKHRNIITIVTFGVGTIVSVVGMYKTFKFDKDSTVTSTLGKDILRGFVPRLFKRQ